MPKIWMQCHENDCRFVQRCLQWCWFTWILAWVHIYDFSGSVKVHHWLLFFLAVFQTASSLSPIKRHPGIYLYSVPSWVTDCYVRLSVTHTHTRTNTMLQFYNETQTEDTNKLWQPTNNTFSHVPHLLFSHITPSLLPPVTLKYMSNTDSHKIFCLISPIKCVSLCAPGFLVWSHVWLFTTCCPKG